MRLISVMFLLITFLLSNLSAKSFVFTAIPDEDTTRLKERFDKVAQYLSKQLDVDVKFVPVKSYAASVNAFKNDEVQLAWFGGLSGVQARILVPDSKAIAQGYEDQFFKSYIIANATVDVKKSDTFPTNLDGKTFAFGSKGSTSGRLMPEYFITKHTNKTPNELFKKVGFSGNHSKTIELVQSGAYDLGAVNYKVWENELKSGNIDLKKIKVIWETPTYPDYQWSVRGDVDAKYGKDFTKKLTSALLNINDKDLLESFPTSSFVKASNSDYEPILDVAKKIGLLE